MAEMTEVKVRIPQELHDRFQQQLPVYGAMAWVMRTTIEEFCTFLENQPALREGVISAVQRAARSSL